LNDRGRLSAPVIGQYILDRGLIPDLILTSTAKRCQQTLDRLLAIWPREPTHHSEKGLYLAAPHKIMERLNKVDDSINRLLILGHNPGLEDLAVELAAGGDSAAMRRMGDKFPTSALAVIAFDIARWSMLERARGTLLTFVSPRDLV
jgi:phosphohistidine phosphatase